MEAFSLLKYWRGGGGLATSSTTPNAAAILTAVAENDIETDDDDNGEDGPFFDLEFSVPDESDDSEDTPENRNATNESEEEKHEEEDDNSEEESEGDEREIKFTLSPSSNDCSDPNLSDDLFFKGKLVQLEPSSFVLNSSEPNSKPQFTASLLKSATKLRVFMSGLKKSKSNVASDSVPPNPKPEQQNKKQEQRKLFTVKFKVEEVPIMSLFTRDNSSRANKASQSQKQNTEESQSQSLSSASASDEKRFTKEVMHKYLKMVKPLYVRVSRRYGEKLRFSGQLNLSSSSSGSAAATVVEKAQTEGDASESGNVKAQKLPAGLRVVCKHLGKSRSASSSAVAVPSPPAPAGFVSSSRRDDSLLQQQDGIQGAILHCKRSFNASRECESSQLPRSVSDPLREGSLQMKAKINSLEI